MQEFKRLSLLLFVLLNVSASAYSLEFEQNFSAGLSYILDSYNTETEKITSVVAPLFSYGVTGKFPVRDSGFLGLAAEAQIQVNPFCGLVEFSVNFKTKLAADFLPICPYVGFSPLSQCDFGGLFKEEPYLNYSIGFLLGIIGRLAGNSFLEMKCVFTKSVYDKCAPAKGYAAVLYTYIVG